jgi:hypothetical protein
MVFWGSGQHAVASAASGAASGTSPRWGARLALAVLLGLSALGCSARQSERATGSDPTSLADAAAGDSAAPAADAASGGSSAPQPNGAPGAPRGPWGPRGARGPWGPREPGRPGGGSRGTDQDPERHHG